MPDAPRRRRSLRYAAVGGVLGAAIVVASFVAAVLAGGTHWSLVVPLAVFLGAAVGAAFAPLFSLARDDGDDAEAILAHAVSGGRADTSMEGAQASDRERAAPPG
jgi:hypothetical protein